ncbi:MAG: hypothetical protein J6D21_07800 [Clostridia bacterium]|nr:hypothetical protein [Clostridia bacterium]
MSYNGEHEAEVSALWKLYENGRGYLSAMGLSTKLPLFNRFYEGDQWPAQNRQTRGLPRPVVNFVKMIVRNKKAVILMAKAKNCYKAELSDVDIQPLNDFSDYIVKEMGLAEIDREAVQQACIEGTYIYHFYWDAEAVGKDGKVAGGVRVELLDTLQVIFENPTQRDEQKQKWIIIVSRESVDSVKAKADKGVDTSAIVSDELDDDDYGTVEQEGSKLCTVLTRYFRRDGEVYVEQATKAVQFKAPTPIAPDVEAARAELFPEDPSADDEEGEAGVDAPNNDLPDAAGKSAKKSKRREPLKGERSRAYLYPIVVGQYEPRKKSIYGIGEVEGLIPNQKYVNTVLGMSLLNVMSVAWDKFVVHPNALRNQVITNEPGQMLTDYSNTNGQGIKRLGGAALSNLPVGLCDTIMSMTRTVTGSTEVMSGETVGSVSSAMGISLLQEAAKHPINDLREGFWNVKKKQGLVLAQFFRLFYRGAEYVQEVEEKGDDGEVQKARRLATFDGSMLEGMRYDVVCEATVGTSSSSAGTIAFLDALFAGGHISLKTYVKYYPEDALTNKSEILAEVEAMEAEAMAQVQGELAMVQAELQRCQAAMAEDAALAERAASLVKNNQRLGLMLAALYAESKAKLDEANASINAGNAKNEELMRDATDFAVALDRMQNAG